MQKYDSKVLWVPISSRMVSEARSLCYLLLSRDWLLLPGLLNNITHTCSMLDSYKSRGITAYFECVRRWVSAAYM